MNDTIDYVSLFRMNAVQLRTYLADSWPISEERLLARQHYEELLKNMMRRAKAVGCDPELIEPDLNSLLNLFVRQNVDADAWHRKLENRRHYQRGRTDAEESNALNTLPTSFRSPSVSYLGDGQVAASTAPKDQLLELPLAPVTATQQSVAKHSNQPILLPSTLEPLALAVDENLALAIKVPLSQVLSDYIADDEAKGGNSDARSIVKLIVQFIIDVRDDPTMEALNADMAEEIDRMLPDIPNRPNIPREHARTLATRYRYAQRVGWDKLARLTEARLGGYHNALSRFFNWAIAHGRYSHPKPIFKKTSGETSFPSNETPSTTMRFA